MEQCRPTPPVSVVPVPPPSPVVGVVALLEVAVDVEEVVRVAVRAVVRVAVRAVVQVVEPSQGIARVLVGAPSLWVAVASAVAPPAQMPAVPLR